MDFFNMQCQVLYLVYMPLTQPGSHLNFKELPQACSMGCGREVSGEAVTAISKLALQLWKMCSPHDNEQLICRE
jgi:hypothetical protein